MEDALDALLCLLPLDRLPRTGWVLAGVPAPESIAGHSLGVIQVALALAPRVDPPVDVDRVVALCAVHDAPEAATGDLPRRASAGLPKGAKASLEATLADELLGPLSATARERFAEYAAGATREARLAKLCDRLQLGVRLLGYRRAGQRGLEDFAEGLRTLDCGDFPPAAALRDVLMRAWDAPA